MENELAICIWEMEIQQTNFKIKLSLKLNRKMRHQPPHIFNLLYDFQL